MKDIISFLLRLAIPFAFIGIGIFVLGIGLDKDNSALVTGGLISCLVGFIYGVWLYISNGISLFDD